MSRYSEPRRFLKLRLCWVILRGGSVAYRLNITGHGEIEFLSGNMALTAECQLNGQPLGLRNVFHQNPREQDLG